MIIVQFLLTTHQVRTVLEFNKKLKIGGYLIDPMPKSYHQSTSKYMMFIKENVCLDIGSETVTVITKPKFNGFSVTEPAERFPC